MSKSVHVLFLKQDTHHQTLQLALIIGLFEAVCIFSSYCAVDVSIGSLVHKEVVIAIEFVSLDDIAQSYENEDEAPGIHMVMGWLLVVTLILLTFPVLLLIGVILKNSHMMLPWIMFGWMRVIIGIFTFFVLIFASPYPGGNCFQFFLFVFHSIYYMVTIYSLKAVRCSHKHMSLIDTQYLTLDTAKRYQTASVVHKKKQ